MYKHLLICNIFFIFSIGGKTILPVKNATTILPVVSLKLEKNDNNTQKISEGESIIPNNPVTLPNGNYIALLNLEKELSANKEKSVVPRKGVNPQDEIKHHDEVLTINKSTEKNPNIIKKPAEIHTNTLVSNDAKLFNDAHDTNSTQIHKPLVVSSEALAKMDKMNNVEIDENSPSIKIHAMKAGSHPGMIMPIVITILVVPMFAVVGYLALKRAQEAWKNRHYKRMDFLLDGMYND